MQGHQCFSYLVDWIPNQEIPFALFTVWLMFSVDLIGFKTTMTTPVVVYEGVVRMS